MEPLPRTKSCFVCGTSNAIGLGLQLLTDGQVVTARFKPRPEHVGFRATVHGGLIATVLDEAMVWVCGVRTGRFAYCAELNVRYLRPVPPGLELEVSAALIQNRRNRLFEAQAELRDLHRQIFATATAKYLPIPDGTVGDMMDDFVGDVSAVIRRPQSAPAP